MASVSLSQHFQRRLIAYFCVVAVMLVVVTAVVDKHIRDRQLHNILSDRVAILAQTFSAYLERSEFEARFIAQQIALATPSTGEELETIFQNHDVLLFGGLDFFVVQMGDGRELIDPRARLFTGANLSVLLNQARLNHWVRASTNDNVELLIYKKRLPSGVLQADSIAPQGNLYGFIALNQNLTLASDLMDRAQADRVRILDSRENVLLSSQVPGFDEEEMVISEREPITVGNLDGRIQLELELQRPPMAALTELAVWRVLVIAAVLFGVFALTMINIRRYVFDAVNRVFKLSGDYQNTYQEFQPLLSQLHQYQLKMRDQEKVFELLMGSVQVAIVFCDEAAKIIRMNQQAQSVLPKFELGCTIFDLSPVQTHARIADALKGDMPIEMEVDMPGTRKHYRWLFISYVNEYSFRNLVMIGYDITEPYQLSAEIERLRPEETTLRPSPTADVLLADYRAMRNTPSLTVESASVVWFSLLSDIVEAASTPAQPLEEALALGQLMSNAYDQINRQLPLGEDGREFGFHCSLSDSVIKADWSTDHHHLLCLGILMVLYSNLSGRSLTVSFKDQLLCLQLDEVDSISPLIEWSANALANALEGDIRMLARDKMTLQVPCQSKGYKDQLSLQGKQVIFIENGYRFTATFLDSMSQLGVHVLSFATVANFVARASELGRQYHGLVLGVSSALEFKECCRQLEAIDRRLVEKVICLGGEDLANVTHYQQIMSYPTAYQLGVQLAGLPETGWIDLASLHDTSSGQWFIIGGSPVMQSLWQSELQRYHIPCRINLTADKLKTLIEAQVVTKVLLLDDVQLDVLDDTINTAHGVTWLALSSHSPERLNVKPLAISEFPLKQADIDQLKAYE